mmetsp:Transcript_64707/g.171299  ORF Transcript_64707/g.171299 Transcript_64707/m.171299 type:complete len:84 (+) Transcript_64707:873-1124(+)
MTMCSNERFFESVARQRSQRNWSYSSYSAVPGRTPARVRPLTARHVRAQFAWIPPQLSESSNLSVQGAGLVTLPVWTDIMDES